MGAGIRNNKGDLALPKQIDQLSRRQLAHYFKIHLASHYRQYHCSTLEKETAAGSATSGGGYGANVVEMGGIEPPSRKVGRQSLRA